MRLREFPYAGHPADRLRARRTGRSSRHQQNDVILRQVKHARFRGSPAAFRSHATSRPLRLRDRTKATTVVFPQPVNSTNSLAVAPRSRFIHATMAACFWRTEVSARHRSLATTSAAICLGAATGLPPLRLEGVGGNGITTGSGRFHSDNVSVSSSNRVRLPTFHTFSMDRSQREANACACRARKGTFASRKRWHGNAIAKSAAETVSLNRTDHRLEILSPQLAESSVQRTPRCP